MPARPTLLAHGPEAVLLHQSEGCRVVRANADALRCHARIPRGAVEQRLWRRPGVPLPLVSKAMGHASTDVTASVYAHALTEGSDDRLRLASAAMMGAL